jgi:hypothetical protein
MLVIIAVLLRIVQRLVAVRDVTEQPARIKLMVFWYVTPYGFTVRHDHCRHLTSATFRHVNRTACLLLTAQSWLFELFLTSTVSVYRTGLILLRH